MENNIKLQTEITAPKEKSNKLKDLFLKVSHHKLSYLFWCFAIPLLLMRIIYMCVGNLPGLDGSVLVLDLNGQYVYFYEALRSFLHGDASLLYSFSRALGGEFLGIFAYYVASPFALLVALFPKDRILEALLCIFVLKAGLCGLSFGYYLHKTTRRIKPYASIIFSTMYALTSYAVVQSHNSMWIDALIWLPIITLSIENLIKTGRCRLFVASLAIMLISHYYIGYMVCIYTAVYFFYYYTAHGGTNLIFEKRHFIKSFTRIAMSALLAIGIAAFTLIGAWSSLQFGKNTFSNPDWSFEVRYGIADLMAKFLPGSYDTVRPEGLPIVYCGTLTLILIPFYYFAKNITFKEKILTTVLLAFFVVSLTVNPIDILWHGFQVPNWLNYRYSFMLSFILLVMAYKAFLEIENKSSKIAFCSGCFIILTVAILEKMEFKNFLLGDDDGFVKNHIDTYRTVWLTILATVALCAAIYAITVAKNVKARKKYTKVLLGIVCIEMLLNGAANITSLHFDVTYSSYSSYNDYFDKISPIVDKIKENDDSFYRMEKTHHRKTNDNMTLGIKGLSGSTSTLNKETIKFLNNMGYASKSHWSKYLGGNPLNDSILGVKYVVVQKNQPANYSTYNENQAINALMSRYYKIVAEDKNYIGYENPYALSLAYQVSNNVKTLIFNTVDANGNLVSAKMSPFERLNELAGAMLGEEIKIFVPVEINQTTHSNAKKSTIAGHTKYEKIDEQTECSVNFIINVPNNDYMYFYAPSGYPRETEFYINSIKYGDFMANESNRIKAMGAFQKDSKIDVKLVIKSTNLYIKENEYYFYTLDLNALSKFSEAMSENEFVINKYSNNKLIGEITTDTNAASIFTSIPYDEGWDIYVDGKKINYYKNVNALIGFDIENQGSHILKLVYRPAAVKIGISISALSIIIYAAAWFFDTRRKKIK